MRIQFSLLGLLVLSALPWAQDRETRIRNDRRALGASGDRVYNDLEA